MHQQKVFFFLWPGDSIKTGERGGERGKWGCKHALVQSLELQQDVGGRYGLEKGWTCQFPPLLLLLMVVCVLKGGSIRQVGVT